MERKGGEEVGLQYQWFNTTAASTSATLLFLPPIPYPKTTSAANCLPKTIISIGILLWGTLFLQNSPCTNNLNINSTDFSDQAQHDQLTAALNRLSISNHHQSGGATSIPKSKQLLRR
ncbi:pumilio homolog 12-like [Prunus yedoensis var. nudiflora]|uniref:Pumilio homolog 12-like n=1 Tax=Prunus yedoensis var. nudiflora TaxID=2094558 RepID=A0A314XI89_PRUYE|nr:pumilio homolog 12-like [Prunus yedoensis var. nudiflora]